MRIFLLIKSGSRNHYLVEGVDTPDAAVATHLEYFDADGETFDVYELPEKLGTYGVAPRTVRKLK